MTRTSTPLGTRPEILESAGVAPLLDIVDLSRWTGLTPGAIRATRARNEAPGVLGFHVGRALKFDAVEVQDWLDGVKSASREQAS
jgi:hypothetical protein